MQLEAMIAAVQTALGLTVDGKAGPETWGAIYKKLVPEAKPKSVPVPIPDTVDARSEKIIATLLPEVQPLARALVHKAAANGITIKLISGLRTIAEQDALYAQGRTTPGAIVTKVRGGHSNHNFGIAFDIGVFEGTKYLPESPKYKAVGVLGVELGLDWGGNWKNFVDTPHYQLRPEWARDMPEKLMLAELRKRAASHAPVYA
jgi:peptidoglycan L-alanyl-D-glutamate endopeptidase CwlK